MTAGSPQVSSGAPRDRVAWLDSVRGLAALAVVCSHWREAYGSNSGLPAWIWNSPLGVVRDGYAAVAMFFVLSGFVLSRRAFLDAHAFAGWRAYTAFVVGRLVRILIPFWVVLVVSAWFARGGVDRSLTSPSATVWLQSYWQSPVGVEVVLNQSCLFRRDLSDRLLPQDWTLTWELILSLAVPACVVIAQRSRFLLLATAGLGILLWGMPSFLTAFALGVTLSALQGTTDRRESRFSYGIGGASLALGLLCYAWRHLRSLHEGLIPTDAREHWAWYMTMLGSFLILFAGVHLPQWRRVLSFRPFVRLGRISFGLYLWHFFVLIVLGPHFLHLAASIGIASIEVRWWLGFLAVAATSILIAEIFYLLVERPSIAIGRRLTGLISPAPTGSARESGSRARTAE